MNQYIITEEKLVKLQGYFHEQNLVKFFEIINEVFDHPYQSERDTHWRDLFVSDLRSSIKWDAEHGNPEMFKAVVTLDKHYNTFLVEQHDKQVRDKVPERLHIWFENYCEGNEDPDLWMAFLHAERSFRQAKERCMDQWIPFGIYPRFTTSKTIN